MKFRNGDCRRMIYRLVGFRFTTDVGENTDLFRTLGLLDYKALGWVCCFLDLGGQGLGDSVAV